MVNDAISSRVQLTEIDRVQDNVPVSFGDTGLVLYEGEEIPEAFRGHSLPCDLRAKFARPPETRMKC